jgi:hypothetical protein
VLLFRTLLDFPLRALARLRDKRRARRYRVGADFPLKATLMLLGPSGEPGTTARWSGRLANFSSTGASVMLPRAALARRGETTELDLTLGDFTLTVPCKVAHLRAGNDCAICGVALRFSDSDIQKAYLQLLETVVIAVTLEPYRASGLVVTPPGLVRENYRGEHRAARLFVWRHRGTGAPACFELLLDGVCLRGDVSLLPAGRGRGLVEVYSASAGRGAEKVAYCDHSLGLTPGDHVEHRYFFRCFVQNLPDSLPEDLRAFLGRFA